LRPYHESSSPRCIPIVAHVVRGMPPHVVNMGNGVVGIVSPRYGSAQVVDLRNGIMTHLCHDRKPRRVVH
jgi:hypothetical protein